MDKGEQAAKEVLIEELEELTSGIGNGWFNIGGSLSYREKKHLREELDVSFIDEQLEQMRRREVIYRILQALATGESRQVSVEAERPPAIHLQRV